MLKSVGAGSRSQGRNLFYYLFVLMLAKLEWMRYNLFGGLEPLAVVADFASLLVLAGLLELLTPRRGKGPAYWGFNLVYSLVLFAITLYFSHFGSVATYTALGNLNQVYGIRESVDATIQPMDYIYFADVILIAVIWMLRRTRGRKIEGRKGLWKPAAALLTVAGLAGSFWFIRDAEATQSELAQAESVGVFNYQVVSAIKIREENKEIASGDIGKTIQEIEELQASYPYRKDESAPLQEFGAAKGTNLVIIQMEAFQNFPIHLKLQGQELTPNLNKLANEGYYFPHFFQQIGQGNTSDAEFMTNTSIYPTGTIAMSTGYGNRKLPSLPRLLQGEGYEANTFHINNVGFWDRNKLYPALNFDKYYDKPFYNNDHFNSFGASDEELYRVAAGKMAELSGKGKPFYAHLITTSSHFPFQIPKDKQTLIEDESLAGSQLGDYLQAIHYTDDAVGMLVDRLKAEGLWENTTLVIYGDHFGLQPQSNDPAFIQQELGIPYHNQISRFNIPLIIRVPGQQGKVVEGIGGQLDILPTVANLMGISLKKEGFTAFGRDLLNTDRNILGERYYLPSGSFINEEILFVPGKGFEDGKAVSLKTLQPVADFSKYRSDYDYTIKLLGLSDAYVKLLPKR
ncbi:LTA synthase family protein [Paenibacillus sp. P22]|uniref:LTA synthase family protein n=1 Tax=Paenibacillus TaxID=44249 RepID=UPI0004312325|nr:LTA synthase family protein [Paenibacillus sp. P22]CDN45000.1 Lipoteichoic acid synthase [Paenibacillus sp. P22]